MKAVMPTVYNFSGLNRPFSAILCALSEPLGSLSIKLSTQQFSTFPRTVPQCCAHAGRPLKNPTALVRRWGLEVAKPQAGRWASQGSELMVDTHQGACHGLEGAGVSRRAGGCHQVVGRGAGVAIHNSALAEAVLNANLAGSPIGQGA